MKWHTEPISSTCETLNPDGKSQCGKRAEWAYPAHPRGWMALCHEHAQKHLDISKQISTLISMGERLK